MGKAERAGQVAVRVSVNGNYPVAVVGKGPREQASQQGLANAPFATNRQLYYSPPPAITSRQS